MQTLNFFDVARDGLRELYLWFVQFIRSGNIIWPLIALAGLVLYYRTKKR